MTNTLLERLAELEHKQWQEWAKALLNRLREDFTGELSEDGLLIADSLQARWEPCFKPYSELTEEQKDKDRLYARKILALVNTLDEDALL